jgi:hypothetical protein
MKSFRKTLSAMLSIALMTMTFNSTQAAMIANDVVIAQVQQHSAKAELLRTMQREDVRQQLMHMGVEPAMIESRINLMTAEEIAALNQQIDELPAGGDVLGVLLVIFIVFVITDIIGATDIFPFIKPVN